LAYVANNDLVIKGELTTDNQCHSFILIPNSKTNEVMIIQSLGGIYASHYKYLRQILDNNEDAFLTLFDFYDPNGSNIKLSFNIYNQKRYLNKYELLNLDIKHNKTIIRLRHEYLKNNKVNSVNYNSLSVYRDIYKDDETNTYEYMELILSRNPDAMKRIYEMDL